MIELETQRLLIRDHIPSDLDAMHNWASDPDVMKYLDWKTESIEETAVLLDQAINEIGRPDRKKYYFAIILKSSGNIIGDTGFTVLSKNEQGGIANGGYFLLEKYWGNGYAAEAFSGLIDFAFNETCLHKMTAGCDAENSASEQVMIKCGLSKEGEFKKQHFHRNRWCDRLEYGILKDAWQRQRLWKLIRNASPPNDFFVGSYKVNIVEHKQNALFE